MRLRYLFKRIKHGLLIRLKHYIPLKIKLRFLPNRPLLVMTPTHGNLGDQAIAWAELCLAKKEKIKVIEVSCEDLSFLSSRNMLHILNKRTILLNGGGYLGPIWPESEQMLQNIITKCPDSCILAFPNTVYYENNDYGCQAFDQSKRVYNAHKHLKLYARENTSYEIMKSAYNNVELCPDVVLSLDVKKSDIERSGCTLFLRRDKEKTLRQQETDSICDNVKQIFGYNYRLSDTVRDYGISKRTREKELEKMFCEFMSSELAITDRMHGMIFAAITETPCIVLASKSHKLQGSYEWIKDLSYIAFCKSPEEIPQVYEKISNASRNFESINIKEKYQGLMQEITAMCKGKKSNK